MRTDVLLRYTPSGGSLVLDEVWVETFGHDGDRKSLVQIAVPDNVADWLYLERAGRLAAHLGQDTLF